MNNDAERDWPTTILKENPALLVSVVYFSASSIGMFYSWAFLRHFGVNVFNFAQISDFLLASLKEPMTWLLVSFAMLLMLVDNAFSRRHQKKSKKKWLQWYGSSTYRSINYVVLICMVVLFLYVYADNKAEKVRSGKGEQVSVTLASNDVPQNAILLGTTGQFIFLYDAETRQVDIHPNENVQTISLLAPD